MTNHRVSRKEFGTVTSYTLDAPSYYHNTQGQEAKQEMTLSGYQAVEEKEEPKPVKKKRGRPKGSKNKPKVDDTYEPPTEPGPPLEVSLDSVREAVEADLIRRGYKQGLPKEDY